ncbi:hypothetical protein BU26DRAFT_339903 [Trematosphaeria pertusa]|uniref:Uncharacterized protein n=1 Tax=Trematosphaeria pertusa TaxID=390896 RepID=A0A6A6I9X4_9PLEO|nr:uncharacterized protein BU26DRAFT_339903 [Trematosphaeria pertusa]KAF2247029.1 hypothetical protein BU26DRAFT_339903 [Trematosphaeria pertusa]
MAHGEQNDQPCHPPDEQPHQQPQAVIGYPFHQYVPGIIEPCAVDVEERPQAFHLLTCGHIVAVDAEDKRCGLNCLHVETWRTEMQKSQKEEEIDLGTGLTLQQAISSTRPPNVFVPHVSHRQANDLIYCEMCHGIPVWSFNMLRPAARYRRAVALTRNVIQYYTSYSPAQVESLLSPLFYNPNHIPFDWKNTHILRCGHEVWSEPTRPCSSSCSDAPSCRGRIFPRNEKQPDAILCKECTLRAETVYVRYATATHRGAGGSGPVQNGYIQHSGPQNGNINNCGLPPQNGVVYNEAARNIIQKAYAPNDVLQGNAALQNCAFNTGSVETGNAPEAAGRKAGAKNRAVESAPTTMDPRLG